MQTRPIPLRQLAAVVMGNALEFYDFLIFGFFAVQIGKTFFPTASADGGLLLTLATFGVGFMTRPLGGLVIGNLGDRAGRKPAMLLSFGLMGFAIVGLALTPSYASIGLAAPLLAVLFRLLQGFALGGEVGPSTAFLMEAAPPGRRALYVSLQFSTQQAATLAAGLVGLGLASMMSGTMLDAWGWRIAMLLGASVVPFGLIMRRSLPETLTSQSQSRIPRLSRAELGIAGLCLLMLAGYFLLLVAAVPCFMVIAALKTPLALVAGSALMATLLGLGTPAITTLLSESLPLLSRSGGVGITYALAIAIFGGTAQFVVTWLIGVVGSPLVPAWYMAGALAVSISAMLALRIKAAG